MRVLKILTPLRALAAGALCALAPALPVLAQPAPANAQPAMPATPQAQVGVAPQAVPDSVILDMREAFRRSDRARLAALLPLAQGHALEPWAAYWELKARLEDATLADVQAFVARYPGTYQEDRLRNDWLLLTGKRRDWASFVPELPRFRMGDDPQVRCYAVAADVASGKAPTRDAVQQVRRDWFAQRDLDDGCLLAAGLLHQAGAMPFTDLWMRARLATEANRPSLARAAVALDAPDVAADVASLQQNPARYLASRAAVGTRKGQELIVLALIKLATQNPDMAAQQLDSKWSVQLTAEERNWLWGVIGKWSALNLSDLAPGYFAKVTRDADLPDDQLAWKVRAALRQGDWRAVLRGVDAMQDAAADDGAWLYWKARAQQTLARGDDERAAARAGFERVAAQPGRRLPGPEPARGRGTHRPLGRRRPEGLRAHRGRPEGRVRDRDEALGHRQRPVQARGRRGRGHVLARVRQAHDGREVARAVGQSEAGQGRDRTRPGDAAQAVRHPGRGRRPRELTPAPPEGPPAHRVRRAFRCPEPVRIRGLCAPELGTRHPPTWRAGDCRFTARALEPSRSAIDLADSSHQRPTSHIDSQTDPVDSDAIRGRLPIV